MTKSLILYAGSTAVGSGNQLSFFGSNNVASAAANSQVPATQAATFSNFGVRITSGGDLSNTERFRKNGANGNQVAIRTGPGDAEDTVNTDVLAAGDLFNVLHSDTGTSPVFSYVKCNVEFASGHGCFHAAQTLNAQVYDVASATRFIPLSGVTQTDGTATEALVAYKNRAYNNFAAFFVNVVANARLNDSIFRNRINSVNGSAVLTYGTLVTGLMQATGLTDTLVDGDLINASVTLGTGVEDLSVSTVGCTLTSGNAKSECFTAGLTGVAWTASSTAAYAPIGGWFQGFGTFTEAQARVKIGFAGRASNLRCYIGANTLGGDATLKLMQNGSAVLTTTVTAAAANQWFENTGGINFDNDDELSFEFDEGTSGSATIYMVGITLQDKSVIAAPGSYALAGTDATFKHIFTSAADPGSYVLTGADASLNLGKTAAADPGSYALTGGGANPIHSWRPDATTAGSYALTGTAATLTYVPVGPSAVVAPTRGEWPVRKRDRSANIHAARQARDSLRQALERLYDGGDYDAPVEVLEEAQSEAVAAVNAFNRLSDIPLDQLRIAEDLIRRIQELLRLRMIDAAQMEAATLLAQQHLRETIDIAAEIYRKTRFDYLARYALLTAE